MKRNQERRHELREAIHVAVMAHYSERRQQRFAITEGLTRRVTARMTRGELAIWLDDLGKIDTGVIPNA